MDIRQLFSAANHALNDTVQAIPDEKWQHVMPDDFPSSSASPQTLRTVVNYHAYDDAWMPDIFAGRTMAEVGKSKFDGDLLGDAPKARYADYNAHACAAVNRLDDLSRVLHFSYGDYPASEGLIHVTFFRGFRAYDLARVTGGSTTLPPALVDGLQRYLEPVVEQYRKLGVFGPAVAVPSGASPQDRLLGLSGRDPSVAIT